MDTIDQPPMQISTAPPSFEELLELYCVGESCDDIGTRDFYTSGACGHLARMIHRLTGYPIRILQEACWSAREAGREPDQGNPHDWEFGHACVELPDGRVLDITGVHSADEMLAIWQNKAQTTHWRVMSAEQVEAELDSWYDELADDAAEQAHIDRLCAHHARLLLQQL